MVELQGEAYFEVQEQFLHIDKHKPFIVSTPQQEVKVLGTHFNINAYPDEPATRTAYFWKLLNSPIFLRKASCNLDIPSTIP